MQIKLNLFPFFVTFFVTFFIPLLGFSQSVTDREIMSIAQEVTVIANERLIGHNIAIGDILDSEGNTIELGKLLADELSYALSDQQAKFKIVDRSHFKVLMDEIDNKALLDDRTVLSLGKMTGISVVVYGKIYKQTGDYRIFLKYAILEQQITDNLCRGRLTRLPSVDAMYDTNSTNISDSKKTQITPNEKAKPGPSLVAPYLDGSLKVQFNGCAMENTGIKCIYYVTSIGRNETFFAYSEGTYLQQGSRKISPVLLFMNGQEGSYQLSNVLEANKTAALVIQFNEFSAATSFSINLHARTPSNFDFNYTTHNFLINK